MRISNLALVVIFAFSVGTVSSCGGSSSAKPTPKCVLSSEGGGNLVCPLGFCVAPCQQSKDCPSGELCVNTGTDKACRAPEAAKCALNSQCSSPLVCGKDLTCRQMCAGDVDCLTGQVCTKSGT